ncbi:lysine N(6)-hydroxylase/L-ornithine N(5)-oxygenase family protein [Longirhabdus pacifica]|uniref:lysine N(6)-hydroxylase/L-ornithine N(5)-oxygenase family protein n=1 Tax=Longirhabdus pacifica TaxID=2305227 RepID=UPI00100898E5|nr:lysine N(6)-hydroxylase/L-ornithine N(5)-oxygenase family protein [Longirhabdus pacifica]
MKLYDVIGIGIGPFNLGLAAMMEPLNEVDAIFFEQKPNFAWHEGMLLDGTTLQVPFLADVVTMADPTSPYTFLNYLHQHQRLYQFYFMESFLVPRQEYNHYGQWVASKLSNVQFSHKVQQVEWIEEGGASYYKVEVLDVQAQQSVCYYAKHVVVGIGSTPGMPSMLKELQSDNVFHSAQFLQQKERCKEAKSITVIGSGQSAGEIFYALLNDQPTYDYELNWFTRSRGFFPMEYSKLGLQHFSPDYTSYFYQLPQATRDQVLPTQDLLYKGMSAKTIADIYEKMYHMTIGGKTIPVNMTALTALEHVEENEGDRKHKYVMHMKQVEQDVSFQHESDVIIAATGYEHRVPSFLSPLQSHIGWDTLGRYKVKEDYRLQLQKQVNNHIFVQNGELHTHGIGAPDLGLGAHRNAVIINTLMGKEVYPTQSNNVFQQFGVQQDQMKANAPSLVKV